MANYLVVYLGGNPPATEEEGKKHFAEYMQWLTSLGDAVVSPANPLKNTTTINPDGTTTAGGNSTMSGYTILKANLMDEALGMTKSCPFLKIGGTLEVSELIEMPMQK